MAGPVIVRFANHGYHGLGAPPTFALQPLWFGFGGNIKQRNGVHHVRPEGFAQVIDTRPQKLPAHIGLIPQHQPGSYVVDVFGSNHGFFGMCFMIGHQFFHPVVLSYHIHHFGKAVLIHTRTVGTEQCHSHRPAAIVLVDAIVLVFVFGKTFRIIEVVADFVAHTENHHRRMVAVAQYLIAGIGIPPVFKEKIIAFFGVILGCLPGIERFVHHQEAHSVA